MGCAVTGQLADTPTRGLPTRGLDDSRTGHLADWSTRGYRQLAYWTSRGLDNSRMPPATACLVFVLLAASAKSRVVQSATCPVRELAIRELSSYRLC